MLVFLRVCTPWQVSTSPANADTSSKLQQETLSSYRYRLIISRKITYWYQCTKGIRDANSYRYMYAPTPFTTTMQNSYWYQPIHAIRDTNLPIWHRLTTQPNYKPKQPVIRYAHHNQICLATQEASLQVPSGSHGNDKLVPMNTISPWQPTKEWMDQGCNSISFHFVISPLTFTKQTLSTQNTSCTWQTMH